MQVSVIICTHNPREDYLRRTLDALQAQTLPRDQWELLLIDNGSKVALAADWDLSWHPRARHIREDELGLTPARLRGIKESSGNLLVYVDDDNLLERHYLENAVLIADKFPHIGAFNGGSTGEYEVPIPAHLDYYVRDLGDFHLDQDYWSNLPGRSRATPIGAGLCVRRQIAEDYLVKAENTPLRKLLGRSGNILMACEDLDFAWCAIDQGLGTGRFKALHFKHLIPQRRISDDYVVRLHAGYAACHALLASIRPGFYPQPLVAWKRNVRFLLDYFRAPRVQRRIMVASRKARHDAQEMIRKTKSENNL